MAPHKQPNSLFKSCVKSCIGLINSACYTIEKSCPENELHECEQMTFSIKQFLLSLIPPRLFDVLCSERTCCQYRGDPRVQLYVLTHPSMNIFRKCDLDNGIPQQFWIDSLPKFDKLIVLDLKFICTDEILQIIGTSCLLLQEVNIVSKVDICKSPFNASVLIRNVSDVGLHYVALLKHLRVLAMDPPRNEKASRIGRCVSQAGIIMLVNELPCLEDLRIESCDIGSTIISSPKEIVHPLNLRKINCHFASANGIEKLIKLCPFLEKFSVTHFSEHNKDAILNSISLSELKLKRLDLLFFSYTQSMQRLFMLKGSYLTSFSLWEIENSLNLEAILSIGKYCPNLLSLCLMTHSDCLVLPQHFKRPSNIFTQVRTLSLTFGCESLNIDHILTFFLGCTQNLQKLMLKYYSKTNIDVTLLRLLDRGQLTNLNFLWLDCTLVVTKNVIKQIIQSCGNLQMFTVDFQEDMTDVQNYIRENNLDLKLDGSYSY